jgi:uncharacterized protein YecA (UPF0149 family)
VEGIQKDFNKKDPNDVINELVKKADFGKKPDNKNQEQFINIFYNLFYITPREEYTGISPAEKSNYEKYFGKNEPKRNDPCPCGSLTADGKTKKYKKCCGKRFGE